MSNLEELEKIDRLKTRVLKYILYKKRTEQEVRNKFSEEDDNILEDIIEHLKELNYINDIDYIDRAINEFMNLKNLSIKEITYKLYQKGMEKNLVEEYICKNQERMIEYEISSAKNIAFKKRKDYDEKELKNFLYKKGYNVDSIDIAIKEGKEE